MKPILKIAVAQMTSIDSVEANGRQILDLIAQIPATEGVDLFCFPENSLYMRIQEGQKIAGLNLTDPIFSRLAAVAIQRGCYLHLGSSPLLIDGALFNSAIVIDPQGQISAGYQKIHLFDIQLDGQQPVRESDIFRHGKNPQTFDIHGWKVGQSICYDIRFSELYALYAQGDCDVLLVPSAFLPKTGAAHWEVLLRARAIESQAYVVASAQGGHHRGESGGERETYGHTMVVDPWGVVMSDLQTQPEIAVLTLSKERIAQVRKQIPMKAHRRLRPQV